MIILDTNVVSEPTKSRPEPRVVDWLNERTPTELFYSTVALSETLLGLTLLPVGAKRRALEISVNQILAALFGARILPFDDLCAHAYAEIVPRARKQGESIGHADAQIAAIALVHGCPVATRDTAPFLAAGVRVINPWTD